MKKCKQIIFILLMLTVLVPVTPAFSQETSTETETLQADDNPENVLKKDKKKKDKEKDVIEISEMFFINLGINLATVLLIVLLIYYPNYKRMDYIFTFLIFNIVIFMLTFVLNKVKISMGAAFGLFAVFSMLRYRTEGLSIKDMTYLFIFIAVGLISAIQLELEEVAIINGSIFISAFMLDGGIFSKREFSEMIRYDNIDLIKPENKEFLMKDISRRTGKKVHRVKIEEIDFLRDSAKIEIFYKK